MQPGSGQAQAEQPAAAAPASSSPEAVNAYNAGVMAVRSKDYRTAEAKFKEAVGDHPKLVQAWIALSSAQFQEKDFKGSAEAAEKAVALGSKDPALLTTKYQAYKNLGNEDKAADALKDLETIGRSAEEAKKLHNEGVALAKAGDNVGAIAKFKEALALDPTLMASAVGMSNAALKAGQDGDAATAAEAILKQDPQNNAAIRLRYNACLQLQDLDRLADAIIGLYAVDPVIAKKGLLKVAVDSYYDANSKDHGRAAFVKVLEWDPNEPVLQLLSRCDADRRRQECRGEGPPREGRRGCAEHRAGQVSEGHAQAAREHQVGRAFRPAAGRQRGDLRDGVAPFSCTAVGRAHEVRIARSPVRPAMPAASRFLLPTSYFPLRTLVPRTLVPRASYFVLPTSSLLPYKSRGRPPRKESRPPTPHDRV